MFHGYAAGYGRAHILLLLYKSHSPKLTISSCAMGSTIVTTIEIQGLRINYHILVNTLTRVGSTYSMKIRLIELPSRDRVFKKLKFGATISCTAMEICQIFRRLG